MSLFLLFPGAGHKDAASLVDDVGIEADLSAQEDDAVFADILGARGAVVGTLSEQIGPADALAGIEVMAEATDTESLGDEVTNIEATLAPEGETAKPVDSVDSVMVEASDVEQSTLAEVAEPSIFKWPVPRFPKKGEFRAYQKARGGFNVQE